MPRPATGRAPRPVTAVRVVVPARDEADRIGGCLDAVHGALAWLPAHVVRSVTVVAHRCRDATADRARAAGAQVVEVDQECGVGGVRNLGVAAGPDEHDPAGVWLLHTDADTLVPPDWAQAHLRHAAAGADVVAGLADLDDATRLSHQVRTAYRRLHAHDPRPGDPRPHHHVFGANLGVRASAHTAVGGFPATGAGEDHALVHRARAAGFAVAAAADVRVRTSARTRGRASGGLADLLAALD